MPTTTVRITERTHQTLGELAGLMGLSMHEVLARAVEAFRREQFLEQASAAYAALRADPAAWAEEQAERAAWDATLADGLEER